MISQFVNEFLYFAQFLNCKWYKLQKTTINKTNFTFKINGYLNFFLSVGTKLTKQLEQVGECPALFNKSLHN